MANHWWIPKRIDYPTSPAEAPAGQILNYGQRQRAGAELRRWIAKPSKPNCPILPNVTSIHSIQNDFTIEIIQATPTDPDYANILHQLDLAPMTQTHTESLYRNFDLMSMALSWRGFVGPRVLIVEDMHRRTGEMYHMSEVCLAFYGTDYLIDTLRQVIVSNVVNQDTINFMSGELHGNHLEFSDEWWRTWEYGTPEYDALLGTRIGKMVAYMVLGGFERGTREISRIHTVGSWDGISAHLHFEIGDA